MTRTDAIIKIDEATRALDEALSILTSLGSSFSLDNRIERTIHGLEDLRIEVFMADLLREEDV